MNMMMNQNMMMNPNMMMMQNLQFMQNQFMNPQQILEQKVQLCKEKKGKLEEEKKEKNNKLSLLNNQINCMKQMLFPWNNNFINPGMIPINPNQNNFNQMSMNMNMNMINNPMGCGMFPFNPSLIPETGNIKNNNKDIENLTVRVMMEDGKILRVYCNSNDKLEIPINQFLTKVYNSEQKKKDDFDFFIMEERKANMNLSVGDNGIKEKKLLYFC